MKISTNTLNILKNFATINQNILIRKGNVLDTISISKNVVGQATIEENFPTECAIFNLNSFLNVVGLFSDPDFEFGDKSVKIRDANSSSTYVYANPQNIVFLDKKLKLPELSLTFNLAEADLHKTLRACDSMELPEVVVVGNGEALKVVCVDTKNPSSNTYSLDLDDPVTSEFKYVFKRENLRMLPGSYTVNIHAYNEESAMAHFKHGSSLSYYVMVNAS